MGAAKRSRPGVETEAAVTQAAADLKSGSTLPDSYDIGWIHRCAYRHGVDPIDNAIDAVTTFLHAADAISAARRDNPASFPLSGPEAVTHGYWARRIVGELLDAGWTPPDLGTVADG